MLLLSTLGMGSVLIGGARAARDAVLALWAALGGLSVLGALVMKRYIPRYLSR